MRALAIALVVVLAGCARAPAPAPTRDDVVEWRAEPVDCPAFLDIDRSGEDPPRWGPGLWWNYSAIDEDGLLRGFARYEVVGCARINDTFVHRVRETWTEYGRERGYAEEPRVVERYFAMTTLHEMWAVCGIEMVHGDCQGVTPEWSFPLEDGKRWSYACCGDLPRSVFARSEFQTDGTWRILHSEEEGGVPWRTWIYDPEKGLFTAKIGDWWNGPGRWELRESGRGPIPSRVLAPAEAPPMEYDEACLNEEARGPARTTPVRDAWRASPEGMIHRLAYALNETLVGEPRVEGLALRWNASSGSVYESPLREGPTEVTWRASYHPVPRSEAGGQAWLRNVLDRFAFRGADGIEISTSASREGFSFRYHQRVDGVDVVDSGGWLSTADETSLRWGPIYEVPEVGVSFEQALRSAKAYHRCAMDQRGLREEAGYALERASDAASFSVQEGSLAYAVGLSYTQPPERASRCGVSETVYVDAVTGAVLGSRPPAVCF